MRLVPNQHLGSKERRETAPQNISKVRDKFCQKQSRTKDEIHWGYRAVRDTGRMTEKDLEPRWPTSWLDISSVMLQPEKEG